MPSEPAALSIVDSREALAPPRVFISYARSDGESFATSLRARLEQQEPSITLWQDRANLEGGVGWWRQIVDALDQVQFLVLVMTPGSIASPWAQKEWLLAREKGVCVFPVKAMPDEARGFAALPRWMRKAHFYDVDKEWATFVAHLKAPCRAHRVPFMAPDLPRDFVNRQVLLDGVMRAILERSGSGLQLTTALQGAGGLGKTTLAAAACHRSEVLSHFDDGILWVTLGREPNLVEALGKFYAALTGRRPSFVDTEDASLNVAQALVDRNCLLVIDDVWDSAHLKPFLRGGAGCFRLVTTRIFELSVEIERLDVDKMRPVEAVSLVSARIEAADEHAASLRALAQRLGDWPLLLELANATLRHRLARGDSIAGALDHLDRKLTKQGITAFDARNPVERQQAISRTLELSLDLLDPATRERCVHLAVFPEDTDVPLEVVQCIWQTDELDTEDALQAIDNVALGRFDMQSGSLRMHDVVRAYLGQRAGDLARLHAQVADTLAGSELHSVAGYRWRWLTHHLHSAGRQADLRRLLTSFDWVRSKVAATSLSELIAEYARFASDPGFVAIQGALRLASHVLLLDRAQLASQLLARLGTGNGLGDASRLCESIAAWDEETWLEPLEPLLTRPTGALVLTLAAGGSSVSALSLSPDRSCLASGNIHGTLLLWNLDSGTLAHAVEAHTGNVGAIAWRHDGASFVSTGDDGLLVQRDARNGAATARVDTAGEHRCAAAAPADDDIVVSGGATGLKAWRFSTGELVAELAIEGGVEHLACCAKGSVVVGAGGDGRLMAWDARTLAPLWSVPAHRGAVRALEVAPDGKRALTAGADGRVVIWELGPPVRRRCSWLSDEPGLLTAAAFDGRAGPVAAGFDDGALLLFDLDADLQTRHEDAHAGAVTRLVFDDKRQAVVSAGDDALIRVWHAGKAQAAEAPVAHTTAVRALGASSDGSMIFSTSGQEELVVWSALGGAILQRVEGPSPWIVRTASDARFGVWWGHGNALHCVADTPSGAMRVTRGRGAVRSVTQAEPDGVLIDFDIQRRLRSWARGACVTSFDLASEAVALFALNSAGTEAVWVDAAGALHLRNLLDGADVVLEPRPGEATAVAISGDGRWVALGREDGFVTAWRRHSSARPVHWLAQSGEVEGLCFGAGDTVLSVGADKVAGLWDPRHGAMLAAYTAESALTCCAWAPGSSVFAVGDMDGRVHFLRMRGSMAGVAS